MLLQSFPGECWPAYLLHSLRIPTANTPGFQVSTFCRSALFIFLLTQNPESISLLMSSFAQASVLHPEVLVTPGSGGIQDEHWQNPTIIATAQNQKYSLSFYQDRYSTGCNIQPWVQAVPKLREHKITTNALRIQAQMNLGVWTYSCKSETDNIWSLEESSHES